MNRTERNMELAARVRNNDKLARDEMIELNMYLVKYVVNRTVSQSGMKLQRNDYDDLVSSGYIGLIKAVDNFDMSLGYKFSTYARWKIFSQVAFNMRNMHNIVHIPDHLCYGVGSKNGKNKISGAATCLDDISDFAPPIMDRAFEPPNLMMTKEREHIVRTSVSKLKGLMKAAVQSRYSVDQQSFREIARKLSCSRQNVERATRDALKVLRIDLSEKLNGSE